MATATYGVSSSLNDPGKSSGPNSAAAASTTDPLSPSTSMSSTATHLPKSDKKSQKMMSTGGGGRGGVGGRHHRSSSLENNIFMSSFSSISPFSTSPGGNKPQLSIAEPLRMSPPTSLAAPSPLSNINNQHQLQQPHNHHRYHNYHSLQPMSLGHMTSASYSSTSTSTSSLAVNEAAAATMGQKTSSLSFRGGVGGMGGQSPLQPYYGTLKSKREQKRMQMGAGQAGGGVSGYMGGNSAMGCSLLPLQQRISSVDDLRPVASNCNAISKSQVRLMREMFEQQQQKLNSKNFNESEGGKMQKSNNNISTSASNLNRKYSTATAAAVEGEEGDTATATSKSHRNGTASDNTGNSNSMPVNGGGVFGGDAETNHSKPPAIQPCSGVLDMNKQQLIKPIAFKPIPFPADSRFMNNYEATDRYGSTPSLNPPINNYNLKFGSTHDLRHNLNAIGSRKAYAYSNLINYDSMDSISPDSICSSQSTLKSMSQYQADLLDTPSPSDSGISELEAALRDRDSELAYLRQTMEHNEKVIFRVHQDKERNWEDEIKRMRQIHAQRIQKFEQIAMMQSFQLRQTKKRHQEEVVKLQARIQDVERKAELQHNEIMGHKVNEKELREQCSDMMEENELMRKLVNELRSRLEESEWSNCQKNGETALLKNQLKEAQGELQNKDHELAQLRMELKVQVYSGNADQLVLPSNEPEESAIIITTHPSISSSSSSSSSSTSPISINHSDDEKLKDDLQLSHLNRIIILKDQIIMAMTNEMQKLKKEVADLGLQGNYEGMQPGRGPHHNNKENVILGDYHDLLNNLKNSEDFSKCTSKEKPTLEELKTVLLNNQFGSPAQQSGREKVAINHLSGEICDESKVNEPKRTNLKTAVVVVPLPRSSDDEQQMAKLAAELADMKRTFEEERKKWTEEKEKVLVYQRQLQRNYLQMCKKNESLEEKMQRNKFRETGEPAISI